MVLRLLILLAVIAAPLEPVEAQYRGTRIVRVKRATGPKWVQDPAAELARLKRAEAVLGRKFPDICKGC
jgi:hypothetical protein